MDSKVEKLIIWLAWPKQSLSQKWWSEIVKQCKVFVSCGSVVRVLAAQPGAIGSMSAIYFPLICFITSSVSSYDYYNTSLNNYQAYSVITSVLLSFHYSRLFVHLSCNIIRNLSLLGLSQFTLRVVQETESESSLIKSISYFRRPT